ncbi:MAG: glycosyltransferase family 2 protein [Deltaproteobacteria bacterium]|nr:glycosyltransferase family 2 protein [Deltaproteobacteria bacterium]
MKTSLPRVAILILNWNDKRNTLETLESVRGLRYTNFTVFLVDNGSTDGSVEAITKEFPEVHLLASPENLGAAGGRNLGLETILHYADVDYVMFLDNDVILEPPLLAKLVEAAEREATLGIVGPIVYYHSDPKRIWSAGSDFIFREVITRLRLNNHLMAQEPREGIEYVGSLSTCCMLVKRRVFETVGCFNPQYFMVCSDSEFCYRAAKRGFARAVVTHAKLWHKVSASTGGGYTPPRTYYRGRSSILFLKEHGRPWNWITTLTFVALSLPVAYLRERRRGNQQAVAMKLRGYLDGLLGRPVDSEVARYFQGRAAEPRVMDEKKRA